MRCLIDGDILAYELGFAAETAEKGAHPEGDGVPHWAMVEDMLERRIRHIEYECKADLPSIMYFTGKENFRHAIAKRSPYKQRAGHKPIHWEGIRLYLKANYEYRERDGLEADDLMSLDRHLGIICTRDKDLRSVPGWHYGWELTNQPSFGPREVAGYGAIQYDLDRKTIKGYGLKFFLSQCLTGDPTDSIPGLPKCGPKGAFEVLERTTSYEEGLEAVANCYHNKYGPTAYDELLEQAQLLWMTRELHPDGQPVLWSIWENYA